MKKNRKYKKEEFPGNSCTRLTFTRSDYFLLHQADYHNWNISYRKIIEISHRKLHLRLKLNICFHFKFAIEESAIIINSLIQTFVELNGLFLPERKDKNHSYVQSKTAKEIGDYQPAYNVFLTGWLILVYHFQSFPQHQGEEALINASR